MKTARFARVIAAAGVPRLHLTWTSPERDAALRRAAREHRVMTVHQNTRGSRKDFAVVGLEPGRGAQFLVFGRSLQQFKRLRIIGIRYELLDSSVSFGPAPAGGRKARRKPAREQARRPRGSGKIVPFQLSTPETRPKEQAPGPPAPRRQRSHPRSGTASPLLRQVAGALDELRAGRTRQAEKLLQAILASKSAT